MLAANMENTTMRMRIETSLAVKEETRLEGVHEVANVAALLMSDAGAFITGSTFLADGGATASYFYGPLQPEK